MNWILRYDHDVSYQNDTSKKEKLQVIYPAFDETADKTKQKRFPFVIYLKKSNQDDCYSDIPRLTQFALRGYGFAYQASRTYIDADYELSDIIHLLHSNTDKYNVDTNRLILWLEGFSEEETKQLLTKASELEVKAGIAHDSYTIKDWTEEALDRYEDDICSKL